MSRRPHKKSRNGCLGCKKRHIKCDENQPVCANCASAEIRCSFLDADSPYIVPAFPYTQVAGSGGPSTRASTPTLTPWPEHTMSIQGPRDPYDVNMTHLELFDNLSSEAFRSVEESGRPDITTTNVYAKHALANPYLMHQMLAASALHLSTRTTEFRDTYRQYATGLLNRALSLFNEANPVLEVTPANYVRMFLFSSGVGIHLLCETLHYQRDGLERFVERFSHCLGIYRGLLAVIDQSRDLLLESELGPRLKLTQALLDTTDANGSECSALEGLISTLDADPGSQEIYRETVSHLQRVFNAQRAASGTKIAVPTVLAWPVLVPPEYVDLLRQGQAEALVILAHYAVLLHRCRELWLFGDSGRFLIESIRGDLDSSHWREWLRFPNAALREETTIAT
ncbi:uncharacterized protein PV07_11713 [Cladophialophora immunda]|uniref:Zn(2)-C6 fungal-type domain-containing protein n=1 Tax=Cladophialophora immunda TaxID=569365 RepID=A0A0D1Z7H1_9EURO|nr:uncharacterized protein PV07_11713 [Cladophialophora immunda]KIW23521.1 hypothetical protein PV07_11713 [Cladophialophora immunda]